MVSPGADVASPGAALGTTEEAAAEEAAAAEPSPGSGEAATNENEIPDEWHI